MLHLFAHGGARRREERDGRDGEEFAVRSARFSEFRTQNFEHRVALFPPVSLVSLQQDICMRIP